MGTFPLQDKAGRSGYFQIVLVANQHGWVEQSTKRVRKGKELRQLQAVHS